MRAVNQWSTSLKDPPQPSLCKSKQCHQSSHPLRAGALTLEDRPSFLEKAINLPLEGKYGESTLHQVQGDRTWVPEGTAVLVLGVSGDTPFWLLFHAPQVPFQRPEATQCWVTTAPTLPPSFPLWCFWLPGMSLPELFRRSSVPERGCGVELLLG